MMSSFSWKKAILNADKNILRQEMSKAKSGDQEMKRKHPDEVADATKGDYTKLKLRVKNELKVTRQTILERRERIAIGQR